jgi:P-type E1-E2 ATPase
MTARAETGVGAHRGMSAADPSTGRRTRAGSAGGGIVVAMPGRSDLALRYAVLDLNGTLALGGALLEGVEERVARLRRDLHLLLATSDTFGTGRAIAARLGCQLIVVGPPDEGRAKAELVTAIGARETIAIGNGANDAEMLAVAAVGICVVGPEGASSRSIVAADIVATDVRVALDLVLHPAHIAATLRR